MTRRTQLIGSAALATLALGATVELGGLRARLRGGRVVTDTSTACADAETAGTARYIRDGATGSSCLDWGANACDVLPATLVRGRTYCIADGTYAAYNFDDAESSTTLITIKKATANDHGTSTGWDSSYGDGQATFSGDIQIKTGYWVFDGATRNESAWDSQTAYGFRVAGTFYASWWVNSINGHHLTIRYSDIGGTHSSSFDENHPEWCISFQGSGSTNLTVERSFLHNCDIPVRLNEVDVFTIDRTYFGNAWGKECIRADEHATNGVISRNYFWHCCQKVSDSDPSGRTACTGFIAMWDGPDSGDFDGHDIYGNVIDFDGISTTVTDACITIGGDNGGVANGVPASNLNVYNNTMAGVDANTCDIRFPGTGTNRVARNNLWTDTVGTPDVTGETTGDNNGEVATSSFVSYVTDLHLSAAIAGVSTGSPAGNSTDIKGCTRGGDSTWDRGAYEYPSC